MNLSTNQQNYLYNDLKVTFYQCDFNKLIAQVHEFITDETNVDLISKAIHLKAKALFELEHRNKALEVLNDLAKSLKILKNENYYYSLGSMYYADGKYQEASNAFSKMLTFDLDCHKSFLALLGIANVHYTIGETAKAFTYVDELEKYKENLAQDSKWSLDFLKANLLIKEKKSLGNCRELLNQVINEASREKNNYFLFRALYYKAKLNMALQQYERAYGNLEGLDAQIKSYDLRFLSHLINNEFKSINFQSSLVIKLDGEQKCIIFGESNKDIVDLSQWPNLFKLFSLLFNSHNGVSKEAIATFFWPDQKYKKAIHDPRLYDLISRLKKRLKKSIHFDISVISDNGGYKLKY